MSNLSARLVVSAANMARKVGGVLDRMGAKMEVAKYTERLVPSTRFVAVDGLEPSVSESAAFVAPSASIIGDVTLGANSSVWYGATVRGDVNKITIGEYTSIGDRAVVHVAKIQGDLSTTIGNHVVLGPCSMVHAATIGDAVVIGAGAQVLDGAFVESHAQIAPGSVVTPGTKVPGGQLWAGAPAKMVRQLTEAEQQAVVTTAAEQTVLAQMHAFENSKDYHQLMEDLEKLRDKQLRSDDYLQPRNERQPEDILGQGAPGYIFKSTLTHPEEGLELIKKMEAEEEKKKQKEASK